MYSIKVYYTTGDTFGSSEEESTLDIQWSTREQAIKELKKLKDHWCFVKGIEGRIKSQDEKKDLKARAILEDWYCPGDFNYSFYMVDDEGKRVKMYAFWLGYFETLHNAEVITIQTDDDDGDGSKIDFDSLANKNGYW